jgi:phage replication O-like protein O
MYTKIPNSIFDILPALSGTQAKVIMAIYRATSGWQRNSAPLSLSTLAKMTGASVRQISDALNHLVAIQLITRMPSVNGFIYHPAHVFECKSDGEWVEKTAIANIAIEEIATPLLQKLLPNKETEINKSPIGDTAKAKRVKKPQKEVIDEPREETALSIFRTNHRLHIPIAIREEVTATVTDLNKWREVCREWVARGYRRGNVDGCLKVYKEGWNNGKKSPVRGAEQQQQREERMGTYLAEYGL